MKFPKTASEWFEYANSQIKIESVLNDIFGEDIPEDVGGWKAHCPEGSDHSDGGASKSLKVYSDTNSAFCFSHNRKYTPVDLWKVHKNLKQNTAAAKGLLKHYGIRTTPPTAEERWVALEAELNTVKELDRDSLAESLLLFANSLPHYSVRQYEEPVLDLIGRILATTHKMPEGVDHATLEKWINDAQALLTKLWSDYGY